MEIAGIGHLENHWSDIYAFFFNPFESHRMERLFLDALSELVSEAILCSPLLEMGDIRIEREVQAPKNKRIDLLLRDDRHAIIIENKVRASLYNPLNHYWKAVALPDDNKRGVVLSLNKVTPPDPHFVNITHEMLMQRVELHLRKMNADNVEPRSLLFLQDFIQNIYKETHAMDKQELDFFLDVNNHEMINRAAKLHRNVVSYLGKSVREISLGKNYEDLKLVVPRHNERYLYLMFRKCEDVMLTLCYDSLWKYTSSCRIRMFLELQGKAKRFFEDYPFEVNGMKKRKLEQNKHYWHFLEQDILFNREDMENVASIQSRIFQALDKNDDSSLYVIGQNMVKRYLERCV